MGPAEGTQLRSAPRKAHPVLRPNPQTGTQAAVMFFSSIPHATGYLGMLPWLLCVSSHLRAQLKDSPCLEHVILINGGGKELVEMLASISADYIR